ncbi:MAG: hypothetical protein IKQ61_08960 [Spirochaetales bacterium]|nr:hypothetical protein [Spirochaetales bacterium]
MTAENKTAVAIAAGTGTVATIVGGGILFKHLADQKRQREEEERQRIEREKIQEAIIVGGKILIKITIQLVKWLK